MEAYNEFKKIMEDYNVLLDKLLGIENEKVRIIAADDLKQLEGNMRLEEAEMLRMKGIDRKREALIKKIGYEGKTFSQIVEMSDAEEKSELQPLCVQMMEKTERLKNLSASTTRMLESKMIKLEDSASRLKSRGNGNVYNQNGEQVSSGVKPRMKPTSA